MAAVSSDESKILIVCKLEWSPTQFALQCDQWFHDRFFFLSLFITFRANFRMSIILYPCSFFFTLHLEWPLKIRIDKKSNAICIFANLRSTLFSLWFNFFSVWFYFLSKCTKQRGKKLTGKKLNVNRQFFKNAICIFFFYFPLFKLIAGGGANTNS